MRSNFGPKPQDQIPAAQDAGDRWLTELRSVATPLFERESHLAPAAVVQGLCDALHIKERQAKTYLKFMVDHRIVRKTGELPSRYILVPE